MTGYKFLATNKNYTGEFKTEIADNGDFLFTYNYLDRADPILDADAAEGSTIVRDGQIKFEGGKYYDMKNGGALLNAAPDAMSMQLNLNITRESLGLFAIDAEYKKLETSLDAEAAEKVLGINLASATTPVEIIIETDGTYLRWVRISYSTANAEVNIITSYSTTAQSTDAAN